MTSLRRIRRYGLFDFQEQNHEIQTLPYVQVPEMAVKKIPGLNESVSRTEVFSC